MSLEQDYFCIHNELAKRGVTLTLLWNEYVQKAVKQKLEELNLREFKQHEGYRRSA